jgi:hypothetical protein
VKNGIWKREENRGDELLGKTLELLVMETWEKLLPKDFLVLV